MASNGAFCGGIRGLSLPRVSRNRAGVRSVGCHFGCQFRIGGRDRERERPEVISRTGPLTLVTDLYRRIPDADHGHPARGGRRHQVHRGPSRTCEPGRPVAVASACSTRCSPGRATDGGRLGHGADRLERRPVLPGRRPRRSPQPSQRPVRDRTRRQGVLARLRPLLPRSPRRPSPPPSTRPPN